MARYWMVAFSLAFLLSLGGVASAQLSCTQTCPKSTASRSGIPNDGSTRCECSCVNGLAECSLRSVGHSAKALPGQAGSTTGENGTSCSVQCPKNECFEPTTSPYAHCQCFECSQLDPPKPK